jgi:hypothetical protein
MITALFSGDFKINNIELDDQILSKKGKNRTSHVRVDRSGYENHTVFLETVGTGSAV